MQDDPREAIYLSKIYLFGKINSVTDKELDRIKELLLEQKEWVEAYTTNRQDYFLLSETVPLAVMPSEYMIRVLKESNNFGFIIPKEGSLMSIESMLISESTEKLNLAYQFIDFFINEDIVANGSNRFGYYPVNVNAISKLDKKIFGDILSLASDQFDKLGTLRLGLSRRKIQDLWLTIKAF